MGNSRKTSIPGLDSRYTDLTEIGSGGMARVYKAWDSKMEREVAVKVMADQFVSDSKYRTRFIREIKTMALMQHPNIVPIYDYHADTETAWFVMGYIEGETLARKIEAGSIASEKAFSEIADGLLMALAFAHGKGIVHRDIKPENIIIDGNDRPYLMDFGIAHQDGGDETRLTKTGSYLGTATYSSPEQLNGDAITRATDVYSLGIVFYEIIHGQPPYTGTLSHIIAGHMTGENPLVKNRATKFPVAPNTRDVVRAMVEKDAAVRPSDCQAILGALRRKGQPGDFRRADIPAKKDRQGASATIVADRGAFANLSIAVMFAAIFLLLFHVFTGGRIVVSSASITLTGLIAVALPILAAFIVTGSRPVFVAATLLSVAGFVVGLVVTLATAGETPLHSFGYLLSLTLIALLLLLAVATAARSIFSAAPASRLGTHVDRFAGNPFVRLIQEKVKLFLAPSPVPYACAGLALMLAIIARDLWTPGFLLAVAGTVAAMLHFLESGDGKRLAGSLPVAAFALIVHIALYNNYLVRVLF